MSDPKDLPDDFDAEFNGQTAPPQATSTPAESTKIAMPTGLVTLIVPDGSEISVCPSEAAQKLRELNAACVGQPINAYWTAVIGYVRDLTANGRPGVELNQEQARWFDGFIDGWLMQSEENRLKKNADSKQRIESLRKSLGFTV